MLISQIYNNFYNLHLHNICGFEMYWAKGKPRCIAELTAGLLSPAGVTWAGAASHHNTVPRPDVRAFPGPEQRDATFVVSSLLWPHLSFMLHQYRNLTITFCLMLLTRNIFKSIIGTFKLAKILLSKDLKIWIKYLYLCLHYMKKIIVPKLINHLSLSPHPPEKCCAQSLQDWPTATLTTADSE